MNWPDKAALSAEVGAWLERMMRRCTKLCGSESPLTCMLSNEIVSQYGKFNPPEKTFRNEHRDFEPGLSLQRGQFTAQEMLGKIGKPQTPARLASARVRHAQAGTLRDARECRGRRNSECSA